MGQVRDLIGAQGAAAACVLGPAEHSGLEEGAIDDQLTATLEQIEQAYLAVGSLELVLLVHGQPRHPPAFGGQRVTRAGEGLLLHEKLLARSLPLLLRHDRGCLHREMPFRGFLVSLFACHLISPLLPGFRAFFHSCFGGVSASGCCFSVFFDAQEVTRPQPFKTAHPALINLPDRYWV